MRGLQPPPGLQNAAERRLTLLPVRGAGCGGPCGFLQVLGFVQVSFQNRDHFLRIRFHVAVSAFFGVLYALAEHDIKRLLAYSSIENIGIILLGLGAGMIFISLGLKGLAAVAIAASLFHIINHGIFKALLFMGAGSIISATHTRNLESYGGLIKRMPQTALFFLIGSLAIAALPPFNGFFSEWLAYQSLFAGVNLGGTMGLLFLIVAGALAFTGALAAVCFVKAFGISFLARPRSQEAEQAHEGQPAMLFSMGILALLALVFGIWSGSIARALTEVSLSLNALRSASTGANFNFQSLQTANSWSVVSAPVIFIGLALAGLLAAAFVYVISRKSKVVINRTWDCGHDLKPNMEITGTGFSRSLTVIFKSVLKPTRQTSIEYHDDEMRYFPKRQSVDLGRHDLYRDFLYEPIKKTSYRMSEIAKNIQYGSINLYILYIFITLIILLLAVAR